jgi:hypothetical protein
LSTQDTNDPVNARLDSYRWVLLYKYYLIAAVVLAGLGLGRLLLSMPAWFGYLEGVPADELMFSQFAFIVIPFVLGLVQIGLFIFAIKSPRRISEAWVRTLHLSINGVAMIAVILGNAFQMIGYGSAPHLAILPILNRVAGVVVFPLNALIPWRFLYEISPNLGQLIGWATSLIIISLAAVWWIRWRNLRYSEEVEEARKLIDSFEAGTVNHLLDESPTSDKHK